MTRINLGNPTLSAVVSIVPDLCDDDQDHLFGDYDSGKGPGGLFEPVIRLREPPETNIHAASVCLHECIHWLSDLYGMDLDEQNVRCLEVGLVLLLRHNPGVFDKLSAPVDPDQG